MNKSPSIEYSYFPVGGRITPTLKKVISAFEKNMMAISTELGNDLPSNRVLEIMLPSLEDIGFSVEDGKKTGQKNILEIYDEEGMLVKSFNPDAYHPQRKIYIEVEAGRALLNYQFLKDFFESLLASDVDYLVIAVNIFDSNKSSSKKRKDFDGIVDYFDVFYATVQFKVPLKGVLIIGF